MSCAFTLARGKSGYVMKFIALSFVVLCAAAASAQPWGGSPIPMRDGSTIVTVGGCLVQYGARNERINNARRCSDDDIRQADRIMFGGRPGNGGPGYGGGPGGAPMPGGSWIQSCRGVDMRGPSLRAECQTADGRWNQTMLDMRNCPTGVAENRNGSLVCR